MTQWNQIDLRAVKMAMQLLDLDYEADVDRMIERRDEHGLMRHVEGLRIRTAGGTAYLIDADGKDDRYNLITVAPHGEPSLDDRPRKLQAVIKDAVMFLGDQEAGSRSPPERETTDHSPGGGGLARFVLAAVTAIAMVIAYFIVTR
ncbi:MAG: hypothetical protein AAGE01_18900 [Pseudomonadota bacterium]